MSRLESKTSLENMALRETFISPTSWSPLCWDEERGMFASQQTGEVFPCIAGEIPDFRINGEELSEEEVTKIRLHLASMWEEAERAPCPPQELTPFSLEEMRQHQRTVRRVELRKFMLSLPNLLRKKHAWTQKDSMELFKTLTGVYPHALRKTAYVWRSDELHSCSTMLFKKLALEPMLRFMKENEVTSILDFGCGWGANTILLYEEPGILDVWSFDYSPYRVLSTQFNLRKLGYVPYKLFLVDGSKLPLPDDSVDMVFTSHVLEQMGEVLPQAIAEIYRVSRRFAYHMEPTYKFANWPHRLRILRKGYPRNILQLSLRHGWKVAEYCRADPTWGPTPAELIVLEK